MATLLELSRIQASAGWNDFSDKVTAAVAIKAQAIIDEAAPPVARLEWAKAAVARPNQHMQEVIWYVVAANSGQAISAIMGASDTAIQNNVGAAVDKLYPLL